VNISDRLFSKELFKPVRAVYGNKEAKMNFYNEIVSAGGEGIVVKDLDADYFPVQNRGSHCGSYYNPSSKSYQNRVRFVKVKRSVASVLGDDVDAFVSGFELGSVGTANEGLVSVLHMSVYMDDTGEEKVIASVASLPQALQKRITVIQDGVPVLDPAFYGTVYAVNGQDFSARQFKMVHPRIEDWTPRIDKSMFDCVFSRARLNEMVL
jgi:hypothetical protein